jgi:hypothetical protein
MELGGGTSRLGTGALKAGPCAFSPLADALSLSSIVVAKAAAASARANIVALVVLVVMVASCLNEGAGRPSMVRRLGSARPARCAGEHKNALLL